MTLDGVATGVNESITRGHNEGSVRKIVGGFGYNTVENISATKRRVCEGGHDTRAPGGRLCSLMSWTTQPV